MEPSSVASTVVLPPAPLPWESDYNIESTSKEIIPPPPPKAVLPWEEDYEVARPYEDFGVNSNDIPRPPAAPLHLNNDYDDIGNNLEIASTAPIPWEDYEVDIPYDDFNSPKIAPSIPAAPIPLDGDYEDFGQQLEIAPKPPKAPLPWVDDYGVESPREDFNIPPPLAAPVPFDDLRNH